jgi:putative redox protein
MKIKKTKVELIDEMHFTGEIDGHKIELDADEEFGGKDKGPKPKGLVLTALAGCTAMDVISILRKKRCIPDYFSVEVEAPLTEGHPAIFKSFKLIYTFKGETITEDLARRAIDLSLENYCSVSAMLRNVGPIEYEVKIEK